MANPCRARMNRRYETEEVEIDTGEVVKKYSKECVCDNAMAKTQIKQNQKQKQKSAKCYHTRVVASVTVCFGYIVCNNMGSVSVCHEIRLLTKSLSVLAVGFLQNYNNLVSLHLLQCHNLSALTVQYIELPSAVLACQLQARALDEIKNNAVGQLLHLNFWCVWWLELAQVISLGALRGAAALCWQCAKHTESLRVEAQIASLPEQAIGELYVDISKVGYDPWRGARGGWAVSSDIGGRAFLLSNRGHCECVDGGLASRAGKGRQSLHESAGARHLIVAGARLLIDRAWAIQALGRPERLTVLTEGTSAADGKSVRKATRGFCHFLARNKSRGLLTVLHESSDNAQRCASRLVVLG